MKSFINYIKNNVTTESNENEIYTIEKTDYTGNKYQEKGTFAEFFEKYKSIIEDIAFYKYRLEKFSKEHGDDYKVPQDKIKAPENIHNIKELIKAVNLSYNYDQILRRWERKEYGSSDRYKNPLNNKPFKKESLKLVK